MSVAERRVTARPRFLRGLLLACLVVLLAVTLLRTFGTVYRVESASMEPTIHATPERVFVRFASSFLPRRFELVVFKLESSAVVKRAAGLPGESLLISDGDLLIEGRRLGIGVQRPPPIPIFDSGLEPIANAFTTPSEHFMASAEGWRLDARGRRADLTFNRRPTDDWLDAEGKLVSGVHEVNDLRVEGTFLFQDSGKFMIRLSEEGDAFELELEIREGVIESARLQRRAGSAELAVLDELRSTVANVPGQPCRIAFENIDNHLIGEIGGQWLSADYETNTPLAGVINEKDRNLQPRLGLAAAELELWIERLVIARDLYYTATGPQGTGSPVALGPDEIFVLGDNSSDSRDSRDFGPVRLGDLAGRAEFVVWPLKASRRLGDLRDLVPAEVDSQ